MRLSQPKEAPRLPPMQWQIQIWLDTENKIPQEIIYGSRWRDVRDSFIEWVEEQKEPLPYIKVHHALCKKYADDDTSDFGRKKTGWSFQDTFTVTVVDWRMIQTRLIANWYHYIEKGGEYQDYLADEHGIFQIDRICKAMDVEGSDYVNPLLERGWRILEVHKGIYHLGHEDPDAR